MDVRRSTLGTGAQGAERVEPSELGIFDVDLGGADRGVIQDALDGGDVEAGGEHGAGAGVSELVGRERLEHELVEAGGAGQDPESGPDLVACDPSAEGGVDEDEVLVPGRGRRAVLRTLSQRTNASPTMPVIG